MTRAIQRKLRLANERAKDEKEKTPLHVPNKDLVHKQAEQLNDRVEALQRTLVRPRPFRFVVRPARSTAP